MTPFDSHMLLRKPPVVATQGVKKTPASRRRRMSESEETISKTTLEEMKEAAKGPSTKDKSKDNENKVTTTKDTTNATPSTSAATEPESPKKDASTDPLHDTGTD